MYVCTFVTCVHLPVPHGQGILSIILLLSCLFGIGNLILKLKLSFYCYCNTGNRRCNFKRRLLLWLVNVSIL